MKLNLLENLLLISKKKTGHIWHYIDLNSDDALAFFYDTNVLIGRVGFLSRRSMRAIAKLYGVKLKGIK